MGYDQTVYELWLLDVKGNWVRPDPEIAKFEHENLKSAHRAAQQFVPDGKFSKAVVVQRTPVEETPCAGKLLSTQIANMGLKRPGVRLEGSILFGKRPGPFDRREK